MVENPYFQFPFCALSFGTSEYERLDAMISFGYIEAGVKLWRKLSKQQREQRTVGFRMWEGCPDGAQWNKPLHCAALYGAEVIGISHGHFPSALERHKLICAHIAAFQGQYGREPFVRMKKNWLFDTRDGHGITYREFSVLCAIYSAIGDKELAIVTRERIRRCALGYRTKAIMDAELPRRADKAQPLTERQLRDTITRLHRNKFFARCTVARRITYYSIRLDSEAIRKKILERRTYASFFRASQSAQDAALTAALARKKAESANATATPPLRAWRPNTPPARN